MREGWKEETIGQLGKVITGNTPPKKDSANYGGVYPFIKPTDMEIDSRHVNVWEENYSEKAYKRYKNSFIPPRSTGVVTIGTVGEKLFQADRWCFTNQSVNVVIPNEKLYDPDFIYYLLKINLPKVENANPGTASGRHHVSKSNFCAIKVKLPTNINTQRKIAKILSNYDDLIENNLKRIKILEEMAQQTYEEWFVRMRFPGYETATINETTGLPEGWERVKLGVFCSLIMGQSPKSEFYNDIKKGLPFHQGVKDYGLRFPINTIWSTEGSKVAKANSILFSVRAPVGRLNVASEDIILGRGLASINQNKGLNSFVFYQLNKIFFEDNIIGGGAIFASVTKKDVEDIKLIDAKDVSEKFNKYASNIDKQILNLTIQNQRLREARDILLPRLMMGLVDVHNIDL